MTEESLFCSICTNDYGLQEKIKEYGSRGVCSICEIESSHAVTFDVLSEWVKYIWREWFHIGEYQPVLHPDSDKPDYQQRGDYPEILISELIQCPNNDENVIDSLIRLMSRDDQYEIMDGGEALIDSCLCYQQRGLHLAEVKYRWTSFVQSLKHHTRYFNKNAMQFFDSLFADLREVHIWENQDTLWAILDQKREATKPVVIEYGPSFLAIFRARKASKDAELHAIIANPERELNNPPDAFASEGRMNPKGISYFYGAQNRETCVAELRPSIAEIIISAEFELTNKVALLDLTLLSQSYYKNSESMFDDDYLEKRIHRQLLRQLQRLIAEPVLDGDEFNYLPTQAMSEYLARHANPQIDGIIFESVQHNGGKNIVLFPHVLRNDNHSAIDIGTRRSAIRMKANSLVHHQVTQITRETKDRNIFEGEPKLLPSDNDFDDVMDFF